MIKISRGFRLIIIGIILYLPVSVVLRAVIPPPYGSLLPLLLGPGFIIAGIIFIVKDRKSPKVSQEIVSNQTKFCGKCGNELSRQDTFCTKCGSESKG
jgi:ribosomal protein S27AE